MEPRLTGRVQFKNVSNGRAVRRFVEKRIGRWFAYHAEALPKNVRALQPRYLVNFTREGEGHLVSCQVSLVTAAGTWIASQYGSGLHQALLKCLDHLMPLRPQPAMSSL